MKIKVNIALKDPRFEPSYATPGSAGMDIKAAISSPLTIPAHTHIMVPSGFALELPSNLEAQIRPRSGLAAKHGVTVLNSPGTIDSDYRGEIAVLLLNTSANPFEVTPLMRIAQMVIAPVTQIEPVAISFEDLSKTTRQEGGFGSTGS